MAASTYRTVEEVGVGQVRSGVKRVMLIWWPAVILVGLAVRLFIAANNSFDASVWAAAMSLSPIFLSVVGAIAGGVEMPRYISQGVTRRHYATGALATIIVCALIAGTFAMVGFGIEEIAYNLAGIEHVLNEPTVYGSLGHALAVFASYSLLNAVYFCGGWTAGVAFYRWSWTGGFLFLPIAIAPVPLVEFLVGSDWAWEPMTIIGPARLYFSLPGRLAGDIEISVLVAILISTAALGAGLYLNRLMMRNVEIS